MMPGKAHFIEPMLLLPTEKLPAGSAWAYELKLDGYRAVAYKSGKKLFLRSRNDKDFALRYSSITNALQDLPDGTAVDGEILALDETGRPAFNALQNYGSAKAPLFYYVFVLLMLESKDVINEPLSYRRQLLEQLVLSHLSEPIRLSPQLDASLDELIASVKAQGLEGLVCEAPGHGCAIISCARVLKTRVVPYSPGETHILSVGIACIGNLLP